MLGPALLFFPEVIARGTEAAETVFIPGLLSAGYCAEHQPKPKERSQEAQTWRWMYGTQDWKTLRSEQLLREPWCRECAQHGIRTRATDVDHIRDHKGDWAVFTDPDNLQSLCHRCHSRKTAAEMSKNRPLRRR